MPTLAQLVQPIIARHGGDVRQVVGILDAEGARELAALEVPVRARLVEKLVRNLRGLSVREAPVLERELLAATEAEPRGTLEWRLDSATTFLELRGALRLLCTWLGYEWGELSKLQAVVGGLGRWVLGNGAGVMTAKVEREVVHFTLHATVRGFAPATVAASPFVQAVRDVTSDFVVRPERDEVVIEFNLRRR